MAGVPIVPGNLTGVLDPPEGNPAFRVEGSGEFFLSYNP